MRSFKAVAVIPAFNEQDRISDVVRRTKKYVNYVIVVDDGSTDKTSQAAKSSGARVISYKENKGKGFALRLGFEEAFKLNPDYIITLDADGQHDPKHIPKILNVLKDCDMVLGSRFLGKIKTSRTNIFGNIGLRFGVNILSFGFDSKKWLSDTESGFRAYKADSLKRLDLRGNRFEIEAEIILEAAKKGLKIKEVPVVVPLKVRGVTVADGLKNAAYVTKRWLLG